MSLGTQPGGGARGPEGKVPQRPPGAGRRTARPLSLRLAVLRLEAARLTASGRQLAFTLLDLWWPLWRNPRIRYTAVLCGLVHVCLEWAHTALDVRLSFLQRAYMTALQAREKQRFQRKLMVWIVGTVFSGWTALCKDTFRIQVALMWHRALLQDMLTVCFEQRGLLRVHAGLPLDNADQRVVVASRELVNQVMQVLVIINSSVSNIVQYARILWRIRPVLLPVLVANGALGLAVALRCFAGRFYRAAGAELDEAGRLRRSLVRAELRAEEIALCAAEPVERGFVDGQVDGWFDARWASLVVSRMREAWNAVYGETLHAIPLIFVSSAYLSKEVDFGAISQAIQAFRTVHSSSTGIISGRLVLWANLTVNASRVHSLLTAGSSGPGLLCTAPDIGCEAAQEVVLECEDLDVSVNSPATSGPPLLRGLCLRLRRREALLIVGPSGSGKTSLLRTLVGLWPPSRGRARCLADARRVMFMPQKPLMAPEGSLLQQVLYPRPEAASPAASAAALRHEGAQLLEAVLAAGLGGVLQRLRGGAESECTEPEELAGLGAGNWVELLSPGEQQRLAFARTFAQQPELVLMDEATSALDLALEAELYGRLRRMDTTVISIAHRPSLVRFHTHVLEVAPGAAGEAGSWRLYAAADFAPPGS